MRATTEEVIRSIRAMLDQRGVPPCRTVSRTRNSVDVTTMDAEPPVQQAVDEICRMHQLGRSYLVLESYEFDNIREDLPQTEYVHAFHERSRELDKRMAEFTAQMVPGETRQGAAGDLAQDLFRGILPGFWTRETGREQQPRCCVCQGPVTDTNQAYRRRKGSHRVYRHHGCGDFQPTPRREER